MNKLKISPQNLVYILFFVVSGFSINSTFAQEFIVKPSEYALNIIDTLTSKEFAGRGFVEDGMNKTAEFLATEFENLGLQKINNSYFQEFSMPINIVKNAHLKLNGKNLKYGIDFLVRPSSYSQEFQNKEKYIFPAEDFVNSLNSKEKIISFIQQDLFSQENKHVIFPPHSFAVDSLNAYYKNWSSFYTASENKNRSLFFFTTEKLTSSLSTTQDSIAQFIISNKFYNRDLKIDDYFIESEFHERFPTKNVIGKITGKIDSSIVITAHFDHLGKVGETIFPGASDNASGVAFILELAKYFQKHPPKYTLIFIAFAAEEAGMIGSYHFVDHPLIDLSQIKFLLNFDIMGAGEDGIQVVNSTIFKDEFEILNSINSEKKYTPQIKKRGEACNSDHCPFYEKGIPSFFIYTLGGPGHYHDPLDTADTLNLNGFENLKKLFIEFIDRL